jgi:hypothetical protein
MNLRRILSLALVLGFGLGICLTAPAWAKPAAAPTTPAPGKPWTEATVRAFLLELQRTIDSLVSAGHEGAESRVLGKCYGEGAIASIKAAAVRPPIEARVGGNALPCYLASYFGCQIGDRFALAGVANSGIGNQPYDKSKVTIVEQTADRVLADVVEVSATALTDGALDYGRGASDSEPTVTTRYELTRDPKAAKAIWRVTDRKVTFKDWECRPR